MIVEKPGTKQTNILYLPVHLCSCLLLCVSMCLKIKDLPEQSRNSKPADTISFLCCTSAAPLLSAGTIKFLQIYFAGIFNTTHLAKKAQEMRKFFRRTKWMKIPDWKLTTSRWASPRVSWQAASYPTAWQCRLWKGEGEGRLLLAVIQHADIFSRTDAGRKLSDSSWTVRSLTIWR